MTMLKNNDLQLKSSKINPLRPNEDEIKEKSSERFISEMITILKKDDSRKNLPNSKISLKSKQSIDLVIRKFTSTKNFLKN